MKNKNYKYIFWDLDGTIFNSYPGIVESVQYALKHYGLQETDPAVMRRYIGPPLRYTFGEVYGMNEEDTEKAVALYREHYTGGAIYNTQVYPGVPEAMKDFARAGYKQVIASSKPEHMCEKLLGLHGLIDNMDHVVGASLDGRIDTKEAVLKEALRRLENPPLEQVVLIGDTKYDAMGAKQMGVDCIGITYGFGTKEELVEHGVVAVYDSIGEVVQALLSQE